MSRPASGAPTILPPPLIHRLARAVRAVFAETEADLAPVFPMIAARLSGLVTGTCGLREVLRQGPPLTRIIASASDARVPDGLRYSRPAPPDQSRACLGGGMATEAPSGSLL